MEEFRRFVMILSVLITEFKLGAAGFTDNMFGWIKFIKGLNAMGAIVV